MVPKVNLHEFDLVYCGKGLSSSVNGPQQNLNAIYSRLLPTKIFWEPFGLPR